MQKTTRLLGRKALLAAGDLLAVNAVLLLLDLDRANLVRGVVNRPFLLIWASAATLIGCLLLGMYTDAMQKPASLHLYSAFCTSLTVCGALALAMSASGSPVHVSKILALGGAVFLALAVVRMGILRVQQRYLRRQRLLVIAENEKQAAALALKASLHAGVWEVVQYSGSLTQAGLVRQVTLADVVLCTAALRSQVARVCAAVGRELWLVPAAEDMLVFAAQVHQIDDTLVFSIRSPRLTSAQQMCKRVLDVAGSAVLLILCAPLFAVISILIPLDSCGPVIFRQERLGLNGRPYRMLKFRTMVLDAERQCGPVLASESDPRVTALGRFLRSTRLDELPQLVNVLRGEMSLVGPRPERPFFVRQFERELPDYALRLTVKPGITGLAQVWGRYGTGVEDKLRLDLMYIANYSILLDINLLLHTVMVVLRREQASGVDPVGVPESIRTAVSPSFRDAS